MADIYRSHPASDAEKARAAEMKKTDDVKAKAEKKIADARADIEEKITHAKADEQKAMAGVKDKLSDVRKKL